MKPYETTMRQPLDHRRGTALFITLVIAVGLVALVVTASDRMYGMKKITSIDLAKQRSGAAAEAVAAMIESRLMDAAADYSKLLVPLNFDPGTGEKPWWGLRGCVYKDAAGVMHGPGFDSSEGLWLNGCLVRWMVEPVRVYNEAWSGTPSGTADLAYVVNPPRDPSTVNEWETAAKKGPDGTAVAGKHDKSVSDFYHFRIVAQAYALADARDTTAQPWKNSGSHLAASQSLRVLQVQSLQLFKYALFYAADAPVGDLDLQTGGRIWVKKGAVHSNGAIYIRGGESNGFNRKNWHYMASGDWGQDALTGAGQNIYLGESEHPITITGVAGVYRMGKTANHLAALHKLKYADSKGAEVLFDPAIPGAVPTDRSKFLSDSNPTSRSGDNALDLNGDVKDSDRHKFNGINFHSLNDSRSPQDFVKDFKNYVRDANNGGLRVATLQNIPELGGRPFESQSVIHTVSGDPLQLYGDTTPIPTKIATTPTHADGTELSPLYYLASANPTLAAGMVPRTRKHRDPVTVTDAATGNRPVLAEEMRLWWNSDFKRRELLVPSQEFPLLDLLPSKWTGDTDREYPAFYKYKANGDWDLNLATPTYYNIDGSLRTADPVGVKALLSFPGASLTLPTVVGEPLLQGQKWEPGFFGSGFSPREVKGHYLEAALFGDLPVGGTRRKQQQYYQNTSLTTPTNITATGLVIRERRWQQRPMLKSMAPTPDTPTVIGNEVVTAWNYYWPGEGVPNADLELNTTANGAPGGAWDVKPIRRPTFSDSTPEAKERLNYLQYLCSQYTVLFCGRNITAPFFGQILSQTDVRDFIVTEDEFIDPRESGYMWGMYGANGNSTGEYTTATDDFYQHHFFPVDQPSTIPGGGTTSRHYRQNVLTIHMRALQMWLRTTPMNQLGYPTAANTDLARQHFTGVVYCHRTRRSDSMHALLAPELDWPGMRRIANNVEDVPDRLVKQTHFRAYWFSDVAPGLTNERRDLLPPQTSTNPASTPILYPPINFPWNWREPAGPLETTRCATRLKGQIDDAVENTGPDAPTYYRVFWNHSTPTSTNLSTDPLGTSAFTYITPQRLYQWGNFCYKVEEIGDDAKGTAEVEAALATITPCAVFADSFTMQSVKWNDAKAQELPTDPDHHWQEKAGSTCFFTSMVINNSPNAAWNCSSFGSAGQEGTFRMMEDWGGQHLWWSGSQVVMNMGRYHHSGHNYVSSKRASGRTYAPAHMGVGAFHTGNNHYLFNTNLFKREGRPPLSPSGVAATRVVNQVTHFGEQ
jgi:hypothetical protein